MSYLLLILEPAGQRKARSEQEGRLLYQQMLDFGEALKTRGLLVAGESLRSDADAVRVRVRDRKTTLIDGPFSESKEMIGGFFFLACESREQALAIAGECPAAEWATVEVREVGPCYLA